MVILSRNRRGQYMCSDQGLGKQVVKLTLNQKRARNKAHIWTIMCPQHEFQAKAWQNALWTITMDLTMLTKKGPLKARCDQLHLSLSAPEIPDNIVHNYNVNCFICCECDTKATSLQEVNINCRDGYATAKQQNKTWWLLRWYTPHSKWVMMKRVNSPTRPPENNAKQKQSTQS